MKRRVYFAYVLLAYSCGVLGAQTYVGNTESMGISPVSIMAIIGVIIATYILLKQEK